MSAYVPTALRRRVRQKFSDCCAYCRTAEALTVAIFEIEHIVPQSAGGQTLFDNLCIACPTCNRYKANRMNAIDHESQQPAALFHPQQDNWDDHFEWDNGCTRITALTATGRAPINALRMNRAQLIRVRRMWVVLGEHPPDNMDER